MSDVSELVMWLRELADGWRLQEVDCVMARKAAAALESAEKDAARYRWLREQVWSGGRATCDILRPKGRWANSVMARTAEELDAAIDVWMVVTN